MLTRTLPLVSGAVTVPWIICHHCAVVKVGREHEHVVEDPLHHVLSLLLAAGVEGWHTGSRLHPGIVLWMVWEIPVEILATLIENHGHFLLHPRTSSCLTHCVPPRCTKALLVPWVGVAVGIHCGEDVQVWIAQQVLDPRISGLKFDKLS